MFKKTLLLLAMLAFFSLPACGDDKEGSDDGGSAGSGPRGDAQPGDPCEETEECIPGTICFNKFCVGEGTLRISLAFDVDSDFDLHVETPTAAEIYFAYPEANGGLLDVDQCISMCGTATHVENVFFEGTAPSGTYNVWVVNYDGRAAGDFDIEVAGDVEAKFAGTLTATSMEESEHFTFTR
jgi:hypothetical protein